MSDEERDKKLATMFATTKDVQRERSARKAAVTRHLNTMDRFIADEDLQAVKDRLVVLRKAADNLETKHEEYVNLLIEDIDIEAAEVWYGKAVSEYITRVSKINAWIKSPSAASVNPVSAASTPPPVTSPPGILTPGTSPPGILTPGTQTPGTQTTPVTPPLHNSNTLQSAVAAQPEQLSQAQLINLINLPKVEIDPFAGDPLEYQSFITLFNENVDSRVDDNGLKLSRLLQYCTGRAKDAIKNCALLGVEGYKTARDILHRRFGAPHLIARQIVGDLKKGKSMVKPYEIQQLTDDLVMAKTALDDMKMLDEIDNQDAIVDILLRFPYHIQNRWKKKARTIKRVDGTYPKFPAFVDFMVEISIDINDPVYGDDSPKFAKSSPRLSTCNNVTAGSPGGASGRGGNSHERAMRCCILCKQNHDLLSCQNFRQMTPVARLKLVNENRLCYICFKGHPARSCGRYNTWTCSVPNCPKKHSKFIHIPTGSADQTGGTRTGAGPGIQGGINNQSTAGRAGGIQGPAGNNQFNGSVGAFGSHIYLPIVPIIVNGEQVYCLMDTGSTNSFMSESLASRLNLPGKSYEYVLNTISGSQSSVSKHVSADLSSVDGSFSCSVSDILVIPRIPARYPLSSIDITKYPHLRDLPLEKIPPGVSVDLLIGMDNPQLLNPLDVRSNPDSAKDHIYGMLFVFGWTLNGFIDRKSVQHINANFAQCSDSVVDDIVWDVDTHDLDSEVSMSIEDRKVLELWEREIKLVSGHYELPIPWRNGVPDLPNNRYLAEGRLNSLVKRLLRTDLTEKYHEKLSKFIDKDYAERVPDDLLDRNDGRVFYLPHHPVINEKKPEKGPRPVFDCSATFRGVSLNNQVMKGPDNLLKLIHVLLRFRQYRFALTADIEGMYLQCRVRADERDCLRFLWFDNGELVDWRLNCHMFGGVWSGSCASFCLRHTVVDNPVTPLIRDTILRGFYVDDLLKSLKTAAEVLEVIDGTRDTLGSCGFNLTQFMVNDNDILQHIEVKDRAKDVQEIVPDTVSKALGTVWNVKEDTFHYVPKNVVHAGSVTRRIMLSFVGSMYDALGLITPIVLRGKLMFQEATRLRLTWDESVPISLSEMWCSWVSSLVMLEQVKFDRCIIPHSFEDGSVYEIHHFSDASTSGYGACSYIRAVSCTGRVHVALLTSKGRLAPLKVMTIPRLELSAAVVAVKLNQMIVRELDLEFVKTYFWTDSQIVLAYIRNETKRFKVFVANRVAFIRSFTAPSQWHFIRSKDNPADILSRGCETDKVPEMWRDGPGFLSSFKSDWPSEYMTDRADVLLRVDLSQDSEVAKTTLAHTCLAADSAAKNPIDVLADHYSSFYRLKKAVSWFKRFIQFLSDRSSVSKCPITVPEMNDAEQVILMHVQRQSFSEEIDRLSLGSAVKASSSLRKLSPAIEDGLLVVSGRLRHAPLSYRSRNPIILPHKHRVSYLIASDFHGNAHLGTDWVLSSMRARYWIIKGRSLIKQVKHVCTVCRRLYGEPMAQRMAPLPAERLLAGQPCFSHSGLDIFGPFYVKVGRSTVKRYACIFSCHSSRAVHLECLADLSTDSFINGLIRFTSRRGHVKHILSDNGTNLVGAKNELSRSFRLLDREAIVRAARRRNIEWVFNPPFASHHGGCFERLIRTVRKVLCAVLNPNVRLTDDVLQTALTEAEGIVNSRPLVAASSDPEDCDPITPNHLLLLRGNYSLPWSVCNADHVYRRQWRLAQHITDQFWKRWLKEYIPELNRRQKWFDPKPNLSVGDMVLIVDSSVHRGSWPLAKVKEVNVGRDGLVRSARLLTKTSELVRPITKLVFLEGAHYDT